MVLEDVVHGVVIVVVKEMVMVGVVPTLKRRLNVIIIKHLNHGITKYYPLDMNKDGRQSFG
jgi:hypothetical protein